MKAKKEYRPFSLRSRVRLFRFLLYSFYGISGLSALLLIVSVVSVFVPPAAAPFTSLLCLCFPVFFILNGIALLVAVFVGRKSWIFPLCALVFSLPALRAYYPINMESKVPDGADTIRVVTFNTRNFGGHESDSTGRNYVAAYMSDAAADVVCFQEGACEDEFYAERVVPLLHSRYPYHDLQLQASQSPMGIFSRLPIVGKEIVSRSAKNIVIAYRLLRAAGDTLCVVNCHLSSIGLTDTQRGLYSNAVHGLVVANDSTGGFPAIVRAFCDAAARRSLMADTVAGYIAAHKGESLIVCGDFNDTPVSYAARRIGAGLTDCFREAGSGVGRSFCRDAIVVRIDHLFCSKDWQPVLCRVVPVSTYSDHYPMVCTLVRHKS